MSDPTMAIPIVAIDWLDFYAPGWRSDAVASMMCFPNCLAFLDTHGRAFTWVYPAKPLPQALWCPQ